MVERRLSLRARHDGPGNFQDLGCGATRLWLHAACRLPLPTSTRAPWDRIATGCGVWDLADIGIDQVVDVALDFATGYWNAVATVACEAAGDLGDGLGLRLCLSFALSSVRRVARAECSRAERAPAIADYRHHVRQRVLIHVHDCCAPCS